MTDKEIIFTEMDVGCFAYGNRGQRRLRGVIASLLAQCGYKDPGSVLCDELRAPNLDDGAGQLIGIMTLNQHTVRGLFWGMSQGNLRLQSDPWWADQHRSIAQADMAHFKKWTTYPHF